MVSKREIDERFDNEHIDLLALMPCPIKVPFESMIREYVSNEEKRFNSEKLNLVIEGHANHHLSFYKKLEKVTSIGELPEIIITPGINALFYPPFKNRFIDEEYFKSMLPVTVDSRIKEIGYIDPNENYTMFTMNLLVIVINKNKLGDRGMPESLEALTKPEFKKDVIIRGQKEYFCESVLLNYKSLLGDEGIRKLSENTKYACHPSQMIKLIRSNNENGAAAYIMPYFYAKGLEGKADVEIIWPKEGAIVNAISMLVKKDADTNVKKLAEYILGQDISKMCTDAFFPTLRKVENSYMKKLLWMGWDLINSGQLGNEIESLSQEFYKNYLGTL